VTGDRIVLIGSGVQAYREFAMRSLVGAARLSLFDRRELTWQGAYCDTMDRFDDPAALPTLIRKYLSGLGETSRVGVLTWDESLVEIAAEIAASLGASGIGVEAVRRCRDKLRTREVLAALPSFAVGHRLVRTPQEALDAAATIGYPVVLKPRALAGSAGVTRVDTAQQMPAAVDMVLRTGFPGLPKLDGVLVEEYLPGSEISVDSVVIGGDVHCVNVARKRVGFAPYFEEVGHAVTPWRDEPWAAQLREVMRMVHELLGVADGVTHGEVRLTPRGPRLVELNCRLGGDFIPLLGVLATGVDLVRCAALVALGRIPAMEPMTDRVAEVRFLYPPQDCVVESVDIDDCLQIDGIEAAVPLAKPGTTLILPPRVVLGRFAALIAVGDTEEQTATALSRAAELARLAARPIGG
jgi:predicted ATP-grasp superfamily ATP-dependent carboligase